MPTIAALLQAAARQGLPRIDAQMLMLHACGRGAHDRAWLIVHDDLALDEGQFALWQSLAARRQSQEPVAYITGVKEFYGLRLSIDRRVLDPRDDTEALVDWALQLLGADESARVLDLGTGSGAIALAIKSQRRLAQVTATDASADALAVASTNATQLGLSVRLIQADATEPNWFSALDHQRFNLIASNPPYIAEGDAHLAALAHEPALALSSGKDGLDAIRSIIGHAPQHLTPQGWLLLEHGFDQAAAVQALLSQAGFTQIATHQDLGQQPRCTGGQLMA